CSPQSTLNLLHSLSATLRRSLRLSVYTICLSSSTCPTSHEPLVTFTQSIGLCTTQYFSYINLFIHSYA
ncbi:MAG: hypothetical protein QXW05_01920, partial [Ignisphaera sp.]